MNAEDDSEIESFDVSGSKITGWSTSTLSLNLTDYMQECHEYYILLIIPLLVICQEWFFMAVFQLIMN